MSKRRPSIPTREEVRAQGRVSLGVFQLNPADTSLPRPRGYIGTVPEVNEKELRRLEATKAFGGLLPDRGSLM
jgi:hypothetical protein